MRPFVRSLIACACLLAAGPASAQEPAVPEPGRLPPGEVLRLFDAYAVVQAQDALGLDTTRYGAFVASYRNLLETRRRQRESRARQLTELSKLAAPTGSVDEGLLRDRLRALDEADAQAVGELRKAMEAVDQTLTLAQRARFRVFEDQIERRKLELLARARAAARAGVRRNARP